MDRSSILRASTNSYRQVEKCLYLLFYYLQIPRRIELYAGREAFVASGRGRRQAPAAGADLRSKYADSPRNAPTQKRCAADGISANYAPAPTDPPTRGESNSMQGASVRKTSRQRRVGCAFLTVVQRKVCPRLSAQNGMHFPDGLLAESTSRNRPSERDVLSASRVLNSKTYAPSIPKLGRRRPKRNRRRSI